MSSRTTIHSLRVDTALFQFINDEVLPGTGTEPAAFWQGFDSLVREDRSVLDLLTADYSFVNERIARHYGIPNVTGNAFRRVTLPPERRGILTHGSVLVLTSVADANIGSIYGIGFPAWTGGVLQYVNQYDGGLKGFVARANELAETYGERFRPPASLVAKAEAGEAYE